MFVALHPSKLHSTFQILNSTPPPALQPFAPLRLSGNLFSTLPRVLRGPLWLSYLCVLCDLGGKSFFLSPFLKIRLIRETCALGIRDQFPLRLCSTALVLVIQTFEFRYCFGFRISSFTTSVVKIHLRSNSPCGIMHIEQNRR